jgi:hypothetical protein
MMRSENNSNKMGIRLNPESSELILEFDSLDEEFQRGFECGEIWACLTDEVEEVHSIISGQNVEMVMRMAEAAGYSYSARYLETDEISRLGIGPGEWMIVVMRIKP